MVNTDGTTKTCSQEIWPQNNRFFHSVKWVSGVIFDWRVARKAKGKVYNMVAKSAVMPGLEMIALRERQEAELEMLKYSGWRRLYYSDSSWAVWRQSWRSEFRHVQRRKSGSTEQRMLRTELATLSEVFGRFIDASLTLSLSKCEFGKATITYLGKQVGQGQVWPQKTFRCHKLGRVLSGVL